MTQQQFISEATRKIEAAKLTVGYKFVEDGFAYVGSLQTVKGCMGQPVAEATMNGENVHYSFDIRNL